MPNYTTTRKVGHIMHRNQPALSNPINTNQQDVTESDLVEQIKWAEKEINSTYDYLMQHPSSTMSITSTYLQRYLDILCHYAELHLLYIEQNNNLPIEKVKEIRTEANLSYERSQAIFSFFSKPLPANVFDRYVENKIQINALKKELTSPPSTPDFFAGSGNSEGMDYLDLMQNNSFKY